MGGIHKANEQKEKPGTIAHVTFFRHNQVASYLHWNILKDRGIVVSENWLQHKPVECCQR